MYAISSRASGNGGSLSSALKHPAQAAVIAKQKQWIASSAGSLLERSHL